MTACTLVCTLWRDAYASITSWHIYVPTVGYLFYLSSITRSKTSSVYRPFPRESTCTITCHVNLIKSNNDSALFPYIVLCHMPNYAGFRKCFPNIQYTHLEIKLFPGACSPLEVFDQLIRTRVSIRLDQAKTWPGVLPVDWCITIDDPPDIDEVDPRVLRQTWRTFLSELLRNMIDKRSHSSAAEGSKCSGGVCHRTCCEEQWRDVRGINHCFWKAGSGRTFTIKHTALVLL
ncbi:uncharacterized protein BT62DRAFT_998112 [Guyanagaster necrorhizus]|uniref:Uncharacterized protein n=1 Tax=Guyanagaster necrorhizus TaxID=856835 RepID=A0A9P8AL41_9AGAR|nr:uncharacterized protein BT62DRAFT_998112 [Guyanagaster necrorhizus MCA 3950]KAG7439833.1 hypothetical protein BT62DRAFT_998112 [Guyanagaster necrorhizus MCA 3950]